MCTPPDHLPSCCPTCAMEQYLLLAKAQRGRSLCELIVRATAEPNVFAFGELLAVPTVAELQQGEHAPYHALLQLFAYGTWDEYKARSGELPPLNEQQTRKLKQLTVVSLASRQQVVPYSLLREQLDISSVRGLEDFVITQCFYPSILRGKLDQRAAFLQVQHAIGRDVRPESLPDIAAGLSTWLAQSEALLRSIEERITYSTTAAEATKKQRDAFDAKVEEAKKNLKAGELDGRLGFADPSLMDYDNMREGMDEDASDAFRVGDREFRPAARPKRSKPAGSKGGFSSGWAGRM